MKQQVETKTNIQDETDNIWQSTRRLREKTDAWGRSMVKEGNIGRYHSFDCHKTDNVIENAVKKYGGEYSTGYLLGFLDFSKSCNGDEGMLLYCDRAVLYEKKQMNIIDYKEHMTMKISGSDSLSTEVSNTITFEYSKENEKLIVTSFMLNMSFFRKYLNELLKTIEDTRWKKSEINEEPVWYNDRDRIIFQTAQEIIDKRRQESYDEYEGASYDEYDEVDYNEYAEDYEDDSREDCFYCTEIAKSHSFEIAKEHIRSFARENSNSIVFRRVDEKGGLFGWFDHKVTGEEFNEFAGDVQEYLIELKSFNVNLLDEFDQVYNAFEALDRDYIQDIIVSITSAEKANQEAIKAQKEIKKTINETTSILQKQKKQLDNNEGSKKSTIALLLAGGSVVLNIIQLVLNLVGVI